jgi:hypothetical protein
MFVVLIQGPNCATNIDDFISFECNLSIGLYPYLFINIYIHIHTQTKHLARGSRLLKVSSSLPSPTEDTFTDWLCTLSAMSHEHVDLL